ncbi:hypothetical protein SUGI_1017350 [Cryptomeria japonica]|nr:hypothetical protein SUGI_1017350 [Cryptomeria japonica]
MELQSSSCCSNQTPATSSSARDLGSHKFLSPPIVLLSVMPSAGSEKVFSSIPKDSTISNGNVSGVGGSQDCSSIFGGPSKILRSRK